MVFATSALVKYLQGRLVGANIRPLWKLFVVAKTLANCEISTIMVVKRFMVKAPENKHSGIFIWRMMIKNVKAFMI
jgi:hypothetical protein